MPVEKQFLNVKAQFSIEGKHLDQNSVLDAMYLRLVGTGWVAQVCDVTVTHGTIAVVTMILQDFGRSVLVPRDRDAFRAVFERWCREAGVTSLVLDVKLTDKGPATEWDNVPVGTGKFGREGL